MSSHELDDMTKEEQNEFMKGEDTKIDRLVNDNKVNKKFYVTMTDKFLSGWGISQGKKNKLVIECDTYEQAVLIFNNAKQRKEMTYVNLVNKKPYYPTAHVSFKTFEELGGVWKK